MGQTDHNQNLKQQVSGLAAVQPLQGFLQLMLLLPCRRQQRGPDCGREALDGI
jgi:hypothetical protein